MKRRYCTHVRKRCAPFRRSPLPEPGARRTRPPMSRTNREARERASSPSATSLTRRPARSRRASECTSGAVCDKSAAKKTTSCTGTFQHGKCFALKNGSCFARFHSRSGAPLLRFVETSDECRKHMARVQVVIVSRPRTGSWAWRTDTAFRVAHCRRGTSRRPRSSRSRRRDSWPRAGSSAGNSRRSAADSRADRCTMNRGIAAAERRLGTCCSPECRHFGRREKYDVGPFEGKNNPTARASMSSSCASVRTTRLRSRGQAGRESAPEPARRE